MIIIATLQQIIDVLNDEIPDHGASDATLCRLINSVQMDVYLKLGRLSNYVEKYQGSDTVADQLGYPLPSNCRISDIVTIEVATSTDNTEYETYEFRALKDTDRYGKYFGDLTESTFFLLDTGNPISTSGLEVYIYYNKRPTAFDDSDLTLVPELDTDYHQLLEYGLIQRMYSRGSYPDTEKADYWQAMFDEKMIDVKNAMEEKYANAPEISAEILEHF